MMGRTIHRLTTIMAVILAGSLAIPGRAAWGDATASPAIVRDGRVFVVAESVSRYQALRSIADALGATLTVDDDDLGEAAPPIAGVAIERAIQLLLGGRSYVLVEMAEATDHAARPVEISVVAPEWRSRRRSTHVAPSRTSAPLVPPSSARSGNMDALAHQALAGPTPAERAAALEAIVYQAAEDDRQDTLPAQVIAGGLRDPDPDVRAVALGALKNLGDALPVALVARVAREDANVERRIQALELLA